MILHFPELVGGSIALLAIGFGGGRFLTRKPAENHPPAQRPPPTLPTAPQSPEQTASLETELNDLLYSVSHDVRAPLRSIDGFSRALEEDYGSTLDATARGYIDRVRANSHRINAYLEQLLALSRLGRVALRPERLDLSAIAAGLCERLARENAGRSVTWSVQPEVHAWGDRALLTDCLGRLLHNAWKFTGGRETAVVRFEAQAREEEVGGRTVYRVIDDGAGFDMAVAGRLFGAFQRLHPPDQFPGDGVGLAAARRAVHRHDGRIWAEARPGGGATFSFTLALEKNGSSPRPGANVATI